MKPDTGDFAYDLKDLIAITDQQSGEFLDFALRTGHPIITDYSWIDREILVHDDSVISLGNLKVKKQIRTIDDLAKVISTLICIIFGTRHKGNSILLEALGLSNEVIRAISNEIDNDFNFGNTEVQEAISPIAYQIILDILYSRSQNESPSVTLDEDSLSEDAIEYIRNEAIRAISNKKSFSFNDPEVKEAICLITYQIIFDILYSRYQRESPSLTLNDYCVNYIHYDWDSSIYDAINSRNPEITPALYQTCFKVALNEFTKPVATSTLVQMVVKNIRDNETMQADCRKVNGLLKECPKECPEECIEFIEKYIDDMIDELKNKKNAAYNAMIEEIKREHTIMSNPKLKDEVLKLGVEPDSYLEKFQKRNKRGAKNEKKQKWEWDYIYYNGCSDLITSKQYKRNFKRDSNTSFQKFISDFNSYDRFVEIILPKPEDGDYEYYIKSMDYYHLEIYKRLDFLYKLSKKMEAIMPANIDKEHFLVKRFHPSVMCPTIDAENNCLKYAEINKYYRPLMFVEKLWLESNQVDHRKIHAILEEYNIVRAQVYELFNFSYKFVSDDYEDISNFIRNHYDVQSYHEKSKVWTYEEKDKVKNMKMRIQNVLMLNNYLFGERKTGNNT